MYAHAIPACGMQHCHIRLKSAVVSAMHCQYTMRPQLFWLPCIWKGAIHNISYVFALLHSCLISQPDALAHRFVGACTFQQTQITQTGEGLEDASPSNEAISYM